MQNKMTCPTCKQEMIVGEPKPPKEPDIRFLSESGELFPLRLDEKPRWVVRCPAKTCRREAVLMTYTELANEAYSFHAEDYQTYRYRRQTSLGDISAEHLGQVALQSLLPAWISSCLLSAGWGFWSRDFTFLFLNCGGLLAVILSALLFAVLSKGETFGFSPEATAFVLSLIWIVVSALPGSRIAFLGAVSVLVFWWIVFLWRKPSQARRDALIAVEQEMLQLRWLPVASPAEKKPLPYRGECI